MVRQNAQARAVAQVIAAHSPSNPPPLRVVNGQSVTSTILTPVEGVDGLPTPVSHAPERPRTLPVASRPLPAPPRAPITPSLTTLEKAVSARIYFENIYYTLLRSPPSRDQRRLALERELARLPWSEQQKALLRQQWRTNETEYLRERRRRVGASSFIKLKTIGHGAFGVVSLVKETHSGQLYAMKQVIPTYNMSASISDTSAASQDRHVAQGPGRPRAR